VQDDLKEIYTELEKTDAIILGSPIYFGDVSGEMRSFLERLLFPYLVYDNPSKSMFARKIRTAWIYTMGIPEDLVTQFGYDRLFESNERVMRLIFGASQSLMSYDTLQFADYSKIVHGFDVKQKKQRRRQVYPEDCRKAFDLGAAMADALLP
ncbi:MAG: flavodoxin family protein, partial [Anaerolineae bacterium]|nr:flavodoxin family protein [Anaerolineae bacterium]